MVDSAAQPTARRNYTPPSVASERSITPRDLTNHQMACTAAPATASSRAAALTGVLERVLELTAECEQLALTEYTHCTITDEQYHALYQLSRKVAKLVPNTLGGIQYFVDVTANPPNEDDED